ncbi:chondroitinase-B domain-containing protein [uncultured Tenacibaculum sp.]|uniref:chondroitinase-B domain-containing protein n=1 Tax=uncultured Tenacibaculum sp. TaxID=174713 RepID=UPI0026302C08|nr:chondroitinase-B domain-containing protein [uncultured Tenacibaculum sp.]
MKKTFLLLFSIILLFNCKSNVKNEILVENKEALKTAVEKAKPGDVIVMKDGEWKDLTLKFYGNGTEKAPIVLKAEHNGKVIVTGKSFLKLGGNFLRVEGLYFKDGYTPDKALIRFKIDNNKIANNCTVTNCVIEGFSQLDRNKKDHWVEFWGQHNQLDHCYITGKANQGPTLRVFLKGNENINTHHKIVSNHFGPRPRKGGPKAETMQIGDSYTSMTPAYVKVENNYFERCNGEVEIISSKSNFNEFNHNIFFQCEGSLVLRHGNYNKINGNIFIGNENSNFIGGIRVINTGHWITNNYFYNLKGNEFRAPLAVMNGIPKSPLNRYNQVTDVVVANNSWVNCVSPFHFSVGANLEQREVLPASEIRSARPERVVVANNIIYNETGTSVPIIAYDQVDGVAFHKNEINYSNTGSIKPEGLETKQITMQKISDWLQIPENLNTKAYDGFDFNRNITHDLFGNLRQGNSIGAISAKENATGKINIKEYGTDWYNSQDENLEVTEIEVANTEELKSAIEKAIDGTVISLTAKAYEIKENIAIKNDIKITSKNTSEKSKLVFKTGALGFVLHPKSYLKLNNVAVTGTNVQKAFTTLEKDMSFPYNLEIVDAEIKNFKTILEVSKGSFADEITIQNSVLKDCKTGILLNKETNDKGDYNVEFLTIENSTFSNIQNEVVNYYRGGYDESTIGGNLKLKNNSFTNCGKSDQEHILIKTRGIINMIFEGNTFKNNPVKYVTILWGAKGQKGVDNTIKNSGVLKVQENLSQKLIY